MEARNRPLPEWFNRLKTGQLRLPRFQRFEAWDRRLGERGQGENTPKRDFRTAKCTVAVYSAIWQKKVQGSAHSPEIRCLSTA